MMQSVPRKKNIKHLSYDILYCLKNYTWPWNEKKKLLNTQGLEEL